VSDPLLDRLKRCTVRVRGTETGSGFYIGPRCVLTCAHVVGIERRPGDEGVFVGHDGEEVPARLLALFPDQDDDLAVLEVEPAAEDYVWLDDSVVLVGDALTLYGFPGGVGDTRTANYEGRSERPGGTPDRFHHLFKGGQIINGFSGGPLLDLRTGAVIGVVTETRGRTTDLGGTAIPVSLARQLVGREAGVAAFPSAASEAAQSWQLTLTARARIIKESLAFLVGKRRGLPSAAVIENFIAYYCGGDRPKLFGGRRRQLDELSSWLDDPSTPYALVAAPAGRGKSTLLVHWLEELASPARSTQPAAPRVVFVPVSVRYGLNTEEAVFRALVARLDDVYGGPADDGERPADLRDAFSRYMSAGPPQSTRVLVVIDGLDEAAGWEIGPGVFPPRPPAGLKVLVAARTQADRDAEQWLDALGWTAPGNARQMELPLLSYADVADMLRSLGEPLAGRAGDETFVGRLHRASDGGDPLVLSLFIEDLRREPNCLDALPDDARPSGLDRYFDQWWEQQERLWGVTLARTGADTRYVFNLLATAFGPLTRKNLLELARRLRPECSGDDLDEALRLLSRFVVHAESDDSYALAHPRFAEYRYAKLRRDDEHRRYEELFLDWGRSTLKAWSEMPRPRRAPAYIVRYYGAHLKRAESPAEDFLARVGPGWRAAWDAVEEDYNGYYADVAQSLEVARAVDQAALAAGLRLRFIGDQWACAYALADRASSTESLPPPMLGSLLRHGLWSGRRCLTFIQQMERPHQQTEALSAVVPHLPPHLLSAAEQLLAHARVDYQESVAPAVAAYCLRVWQLGERDRAVEYARNWEPGVARGMALATLAAQTEDRAQRSTTLLESLADVKDLDPIELDKLLRCVRSEFSRFAAPPLATPEDDEWVLPGLDAETRAEALRLTLDYVSDREGSPASLDQLWHFESGQYLEYALPWLTRSEAASQLSRLFAAIEAGKMEYTAITVITDVARFVHDELLEAATRAASSLEHQPHYGPEEAALGVLLLTTASQRGGPGVEVARPFLKIAENRSNFPGLDDRCGFFAGLAKSGLGDEVIEIIRRQEGSGDTLAKELLEAIAPHLDLTQTERCLAYAQEFTGDSREESLPVVCARLAEFGPQQARVALSALLDQSSLGLRLASAALDVWLGGAGWDDDFLRLVNSALASADDCEAGLNALAATAGRSPAPLSPAEFIEIVDGLDKNLILAEALAILAPHLSREAVLDPQVQHTYLKLPFAVGYREESDYIFSFTRRLVELAGKEAAIRFGLGLPKVHDFGWLMPPAALRAIPELPPRLVELQREMAEELGEPWHRSMALAALVPYIGDELWSRYWREATGDVRWLDFFEYLAFRTAGMLEHLPKEMAERAFADAFEPYFRDQKTREKFLAADTVRELAKYYPLSWLDDIKINHIRTDSGTDRNLAFGAVAVRLAELGQTDRAFQWMSWVSSVTPRVVASGIAVMPAEAIPEWVNWSLDSLTYYDSYPRIWRSLFARLPEMTLQDTFSLYEACLDRISKRQRRHALTELLGFLPAIERLGGRESLARVRSALDDC
jgi:hypothetical protein